MKRQGTKSVYLAGREGELRSIDELRARAWLGHGTGLLLRGAPGAGKTALLRAVCERARRAGAVVVHAGADRWETDCPYGVVRQLLEHADGPWPASGPAELCDRALALAPEGPLLIAVDDLPWADAASARWLAYLLRRIRGRRVLVVATERLPAPGIATTLRQHFDHAVTLGGLHTEAVTDLAAEVLGTPVGKEYGALCHQATDGNPGLLGALLRAVREDGHVVPSGLLGQTLAAPPPAVLVWVRQALASCGSGASELAQAIAVFDEPVELDLAATTAGHTAESVAPLVDELAAARLLDWRDDRLMLRPPLVQAAVLGGLAPGARRMLHARAARQLHAQGAPAAEVAAPLLRSGPIGEPWAADVLRAAAARATARGAPHRALDCLRLALREPVSPPRRAELMVLLGSIHPPGDVDAAVGYLRRAMDLTPDLAVRAAAARRLAGLLCLSQQHREAMSVLRQAALPQRGRSPALVVSLEVEEALLGVFHLPTPHAAVNRLADRLSPTGEPDDQENGALAIAWSLRAMAAGEQRPQAVRLASRALDLGLPPMHEASLQHPTSVLTLAVAGELETALRHADMAVALARRTHSALGGARALAVRSEVHYRLGRLEECRTDAQACRAALTQFGARHGDALSLAAFARLADVLGDQGDLDGAEQVIADALAGRSMPASLPGTWLLFGRGRLRLARGDIRDGLADLLQTGRLLDSWHVTNPAVIPWRSLAATGYAALGQHATARELIDEELALAHRWGSTRALGITLRTAGTLAKGSAAVHLLHQAVTTLRRSDAALEQARALADLGAALRKTNRLADARHHLRQAATFAQQCGATVLVRQARAELLAAGARPRSQTHCGPASLTPTEYRVATLAAQGLSNRDIAERLFVVRRTVELHLSSAYRKLGIRGRNGLSAALLTERT